MCGLCEAYEEARHPMGGDWYTYYDKSSFVGCNPVEVGKAATERIAELEAALRDLVDAVKAGEAVSGAEAMGAAEAALANQK